MSIASQFTGTDKPAAKIGSNADLLLSSFALLGVDGRNGGTPAERAAVQGVVDYKIANGASPEATQAWANRTLVQAAPAPARVARPGSTM